MKDSIARMIGAKSHLAQDAISTLMDKTTWMDPAECFEKGFCNEIEVTSQANKKYVGNPKAFWKAASDILNNVFNTPINSNTMNTFGKITMKLGLNDGATEDNVVSAIKSIEDKAYTAGVDKIAAENKLTEVTNACSGAA